MVKELLKKLSNAHGISGSEESVAAVIREEVAPYVDEIRQDTMGNLIAVKKGDDFSILLAAHMDEIGLMVKYVDERGFVRFATVGGWFDPTLYAQRVILHGTKGPVYGVVGGKPPHVMKEEDRKKPLKVDDMFIDVGAISAEDAEALGIEVGTPVTVDRESVELANGRVTGKALDNRAGCAMLIKTLQTVQSPHTIYGVFTVQEEVGLKGAKTVAYSLNPDCAIATDTTIPGDHPGIEKKDASLQMGEGPVITIIDSNGRGLIANKKVVAWLRKAAAGKEIKVQLEVGKGGTTDATTIHLERGGIPSTTLSIPTRYIHSPVEVLDIKDIEGGVALLVEALKSKPDF